MQPIEPTAAASGITPRRIRIGFAEELRRRWCRNTIFYTMLLNAYTIMFPAVERFTVATLRGMLGEIKDPRLLEQTRAMIAQEAIHAHQHEASFSVLDNSQLRYQWLARFNDAVMGFIVWLSKGLRGLGRYFLVAGVVGGEHWTTIISRWSLKRRAFDHFDGPMNHLYAWHALEELEHKSVAFDVLQHIKPGYFLRVSGFLMSTLFFFFMNFVTLAGVMMQLKVRDWLNPRLYFEMFVFAFIWPGALFQLIWGIIEFCLPGYHPNRHDDSDIMAFGQALVDQAAIVKAEG